MARKDPRVDAYIAAAAPFARPILKHLRKVVHTGCPQVEETMKWSMPHFLHHGILCGMAAFKAHCTFGFWKGRLILGPDAHEDEAMGQFGRITSLADLPPPKVLVAYVRKAVTLNESDAKSARLPRPKQSRGDIEVPPILAEALSKNRRARETFAKFPPSHRREYIDWIAEAKREETRQRRLATAIEWMAEGKSRHWRYER